ncbi:MAG: SDR family oxidoreductase [Sphingobium sp.]|uniref:SDR family oxidoreductase n=1 Tax=Sphingobium sp. TaxID=1912891 RepID=UPI0029A71097|nr:SDR family oxidoreductase [Sphingobium sp.]MDX3910685.1 SDR family oxidoreductase [Sphingobium sp.]
MSVRLKELAQQCVVVTGASSGIGLATARRAAARGARVLLAARDDAALATICDEIRRNGGTTEYLAIDVASEDAVQQLADKAVERFGGFDTWVNNAGVGLIGPLRDIPTEDHRRVFDTNYWGVVYGSLAAARHFRERGTAGAIINLGSVGSDVQAPFATPYTATKFAIKAFTDGLRIELMQEKLPVSVTLIKPSTIDTGFFVHAKTTFGTPTKAPPPRYTPEVVVDAILYAAEHPKRSIPVGNEAIIGAAVAWLFPGLTDRAFSKITPEAMADREHDQPKPDNLSDVPAEGKERYGWYSARSFSVTTAAQTHPKTTLAAAATLSVLAIAAIPSIRRRLASTRK